uniref:Sulfotransferase family 4A member 1 n=2 Tax=Macaca TaxID=9539 RepID=A0A5F7ZGQ2_MACMU
MAESEAETPSTPGEFESKYFEFHGVRLPPFCRGKMEEIANFPVRPSDVWWTSAATLRPCPWAGEELGYGRTSSPSP